MKTDNPPMNPFNYTSMKLVNQIKDIFERALKIGIDPDLGFAEKLRIELSNQFVLIGGPLLVLHTIFNIIGPKIVLDYYFTSVWLLLLVSSITLNYFKKHKLSRLFMIIFGATYVSLIHYLFGAETRMEAMYLLFVIASIYFFDNKVSVWIISYVLILYLSMTIYALFFPPPRSEKIIESGPIGYFLFSVLSVYFLTRKVMSENNKYYGIIREKNLELKDRNEALSRFNHIVSHDLKEPIRSIVSFSKLLKRNLGKPNERDEFLNFIINSGNQLNNLVEDIRDFQEVDSKSFKIEPIFIHKLVEEVKDYLQELIRQSNAVVLCEQFPLIYTSKSALFLLLKNLIENGLKYNDSEFPVIEISGSSMKNELKVYVKDNGIGISEEYFDQVFVMFKRLNATKSKGSGLGLNIAKKTINRLGGNLEIVSSTLGVGTTFMISLKMQNERKPAQVF